MKMLLLALLCLNFGFADEFKELKSEFFEGKAYLKALKIDENLSSGIVKFEKAAKTFWYTHPKGQVLIILDGEGWTQIKGREKVALKKRRYSAMSAKCASLARSKREF